MGGVANAREGSAERGCHSCGGERRRALGATLSREARAPGTGRGPGKEDREPRFTKLPGVREEDDFGPLIFTPCQYTTWAWEKFGVRTARGVEFEE